MADAFAFVLHSHLPYARGAGRWPHGEEWVHEAVLGTYLPLLVRLHDLRDAGVAFRITIGLTPVLLDQLADREVIDRSVEYIDDQVARAETDLARAADDAERRALATFYRDLYRSLGEAYVGRFDRDIPGAFADLARSGHAELLTSAATHGYLPMLDERTVHLQLETGRRTSRRLIGLEPTGIWLPECAYRPGLERILEEHGFTHFFSDANLLGPATGPGRMRRVPGERERDRSGAGLLGDLRALEPGERTRAGEADIFHPYLVGPSDVAVVARHPEVSGQVWSAMFGYPGDPMYREFHRKDATSGLRYWRVTDMNADLGAKRAYDPRAAAERVEGHADHFVSVARAELGSHRSRYGHDGLLTVTFDSELFGHWWFEGVDWLAAVLRRFADGGPRTTTIAEHIAASPPDARIELREGSWGKNNDHSTWVNGGTEWIWRELDGMQERYAEAVARAPRDELHQRALRQATRELLLASSSDWPFLISTVQAADYAAERFRGHEQRFDVARRIALEGSASDERELERLEHVDDAFPEVDPRAFARG